MQDGVQHIVSDRVQYPGDHDILTIVIAFHLLVLQLVFSVQDGVRGALRAGGERAMSHRT